MTGSCFCDVLKTVFTKKPGIIYVITQRVVFVVSASRRATSGRDKCDFNCRKPTATTKNAL